METPKQISGKDLYESVARIKLDASQDVAGRVSSPESRSQKAPGERKTPRGRNDTLGKYDE